MTSASAAIVEVVHEQWPRVMATLVADLGDLSLAEDAAQDAIEAALTTWAESGVPDRPGAWICTVARRKAIDRIRRDKNRMVKSEALARLEARDAEVPTGHHFGQETRDEEDGLVRDEQLQLIFGCCHPALSVEAQTALTLKAVCGLTTPEIAAGFVVPEATMAQRLVRAKRKIRAAGVPFRIPRDQELLERVRVVHHVVYLLFNEGYSASGGPHLQRQSLCDEAIRLGGILADLLADDAESFGLVALMMLTHARRRARVSAAGDVVVLDAQDRTVWDQAMIQAGQETLDRALRLGRVGPYQLQAAIASLHDEATTAEATDWPQIVALYDRWLRMAPTPIVELNSLAARSMANGPEVALEEMDRRGLEDSLHGYGPYWALRADVLRRLDRIDEARTAYARAGALAGSDAERRFFAERGALLS